MVKLIAITGGIGSGKSVVSSMLRAMGFEVYDCDSRAKRIMDTDSAIKIAIAQQISSQAIRPDGSIDRSALAAIVFNDASALSKLNQIVHSAVRRNLSEWSLRSPKLKFVETAILYQSGLDMMVDEVWNVTAPDELRIARVMQRNNLTRTEVEHRIASQHYTPEREHARIMTITNDTDSAVLPQVLRLLENQKL